MVDLEIEDEIIKKKKWIMIMVIAIWGFGLDTIIVGKFMKNTIDQTVKLLKWKKVTENK